MNRSIYVFSALALLLVAFGVYHLFLREKTEAPPTKTYSATPAKSDTQKQETSADSELLIDSPGETLTDMEVTDAPSDSEMSDSEADNATANPEDSVATDSAQQQTGFTEAEITEVKAEMEAARKTLAGGEALLERAQQSLDASIPIILEHLNSLSPQEQREFLDQVRNSLRSQLTPEVAALVDENPEILEQAWEEYFGMLIEAGYQPPE